MARNQGNRSSRSSERSAFSFTDTARENPLAAAAAVGGAVAAGVFLWSRRNRIGDQIGQLTDQFNEWRSGSEEPEFEGAARSGTGASMNPGTPNRAGAGPSPGNRSTRGATGMSETGGGDANLGRRSGGSGIKTNASSRGRARGIPSTT